MAKLCVGIDLGGTFIKFALLDRQMTIVASTELPTPNEGGPEPVIQTMARGARRVIQAGGAVLTDVAGIGIGSPGPLDIENGIVIGMPNIPGFANTPLRDRVSALVGLPAALENDANAAGLGEFLCGSGRGTHSMVFFTLGTGVGSGIVIDGRVLHGAHGIGAEMGHLIVVPNGEPCGCGQRGCLERYASATYLALLARRAVEAGRASSLADVLKRAGEITSRDVNDARRAGDALAGEIWDQAMFYLALACVSTSRIIDPDLIVLGGGMAKAGEDLLAPVLAHYRRQHWKLTEPMTRIELATLGNDAGVIGAAGVAWSKFGG